MNYVSSWLLIITTLCSYSTYANLTTMIEKIKPAVVGIGVYTPTGQPQNVIHGTGFVVGDGHYIVTNYHVISTPLDEALLQKIAVFTGTGAQSVVRIASLVTSSERDDLAILKITGTALPTVSLASEQIVPEGTDVAFTGFPLGAVLGLYPVTHHGIISSITPIVVPVPDARQISIQMLKQMRHPYLVYQLDATAYPGNSGSAMYDVHTGKVIGIINKVFVQSTKEAVIDKPSGITYAIPVKYLIQLLRREHIAINH